MEAIKNRYDFVFLFDVKDGNPNGDPDFDNQPRIDEETEQGLVTDVCLKRKVRNYVQLLKGLESPYDIFIREGNVLNTIIDEKKAQKAGRDGMCAQYYDIRTFGAVMSTSDEKATDRDSDDSKEQKDAKKKENKGQSKIKGLGVVRGPVQFTFARSIDPISSNMHSITRCCVTKAGDADKNNTFGNKYTVSYGLYRMHGFISATDAAKTGFSEEDKNLLFDALINAFENDRAAARGEMNPRALIVFKHDSPLGNARAGQLFDCVHVTRKEGVTVPRSFADYEVTVDENDLPEGVAKEELI
nr:MAG TPA: CRISPR-associated protein [Crassvirales sp.]